MAVSSPESLVIDFDRIRQSQVKNLLRMHGIERVSDLDKLRSICFDPGDALPYFTHAKSFSVAANIDRVWNMYKTIKPEEAWKGDTVGFGLQYSRKEKKVTYPGDPFENIEDGLIIVVHLRLLGGLIRMAVAHEITQVDDGRKEIKICYVEKGASVGSQWISFAAPNNSTTIVTHHTQYRSASKFRDTRLYPFFHEKAMSEFHHNIIRKILAQAR